MPSTTSDAVERVLRRSFLRLLSGEGELRLTSRAPTPEALRREFAAIDALGLYIHIPFCERICPYCPYNKELYRSDVAAAYAAALQREMDLYADIVGDRPVTSFYIGGGTPTTMLRSGLAEIIGHARRVFDVRCDIHMESHLNHLSDDNLAAIDALGVRHLSMGVEALSDRHLRTLGRPYSAVEAKEAVARAVAHGFTCVNVDVMFDLPGQTFAEVERTADDLVGLGVDQVAAYPLFLFPYTPMGRANGAHGHVVGRSLRRRRMLGVFEDVFYTHGYERTSVWAFTKKGVPRYCSVTVPLYLGLGASGGTYLRELFYLNTFSVTEYVAAMGAGGARARRGEGSAIALSVALSDGMQRAGWLYWRIYETRFRKATYRERFGVEHDAEYGRYLRALGGLGLLRDDGAEIALSDRGAFWLHACEDLLSIDYVSKLWGEAQRDPWPEATILA